MQIDINGTTYELGYNLGYDQTNEDGAYQDKLKYRLVNQNNFFIPIIQALAREITEMRQIINNLIRIYVWAADDNTAILSDDNTILTFCTYSASDDT